MSQGGKEETVRDKPCVGNDQEPGKYDGPAVAFALMKRKAVERVGRDEGEELGKDGG